MLEYFERLLFTDDRESVWQTHSARMNDFGFDRILYGAAPFRSAPGVFDLEDAQFLSNHNKAYIAEYLQPDMFYNDYIVRWAYSNNGPFLWSELDKTGDGTTLTYKESKTRAMQLRHGVNAGVTIVFRERSLRSIAGIALCAKANLNQDDVDQIWADNGRMLMVINQVFHQKMCRMPYLTSQRPITERQRQVLEWVADGKTANDIALLMGLTTATVEKHLRLARETLGVETTTQAVVKAISQNRLFRSE